MILNLIIVALFAISLVLRAGGDRDYTAAGLGAMLPGWLWRRPGGGQRLAGR